MKKKLTMTAVFLYSTFLLSQVGINNPDPTATLDVLSKGNSADTKSLKINNNSNQELLTVLDNGNIGINNSSPTTKLEIKSDAAGAVKIVDGTQKEGRLLTSDANGVGTWQPKESKGAKIYLSGTQNFSTSEFTVFNGTSIIENDDIGGITASGSTIYLPKGKYIVFVEEDISTEEYGLFVIMTPDNRRLFGTIYGATFRGSFIADFSDGANGFYMQFQGYLNNPNPLFYESSYINKFWSGSFTIHKLD